MSESHSEPTRASPDFHRRARWILTAFLFTFMVARITVFLIVSRRIPDIYLHLGGAHIHHLNYGIFPTLRSGSLPAVGSSGRKGIALGDGALWYRTRVDVR